MLSARRTRLLGRLRKRKSREREGRFLVEGVRSAREAVTKGAVVAFGVVSPRLQTTDAGRELARRLRLTDVEVIEVTDDELSALSDTENPQGIMLVCLERPHALSELLNAEGEGLLVLDAVQDPGNVGTLIRSAAAFGLRGVVALDGTADPYGPKAVRASAGALFSIGITRCDADDLTQTLEGAGETLLLADPAGSDLRSYSAPARWALVVGNEGAGFRPTLRATAHTAVRIPMAPGVDSLNASLAGAILLFTLTSRRVS